MAKSTKQIDQELMRILKVIEVSRIICDTNMGTLKLSLRKGEKDYRFHLDSVPLPKDLHNEIYDLLYKPEIPQPITATESVILHNTYTNKMTDITKEIAKNKGGRPKKVK